MRIKNNRGHFRVFIQCLLHSGLGVESSRTPFPGLKKLNASDSDRLEISNHISSVS